MIDPHIQAQIQGWQQGALTLDLAFIGIHNGLLDHLERVGESAPEPMAQALGLDVGYVRAWCEAAFAFELLDREAGAYRLTALGEAFLSQREPTLMPAAVGSLLAAHMAERAAGLMASGERPGEGVLAERETLLAWFGPMLEHSFGALFERHILPAVPDFARVDEAAGLALDLGCGNGWYLRILARHFPRLRGLGLDGFEENVRQAQVLAERDGVADRLRFQVGDIYRFEHEAGADLIAMNRALHHVWDQRQRVFRILHDHLKPGGVAVIWEPAWPAALETLRKPSYRPMAFQNLAEYVQGNHFLRPEEIQAAFAEVGMESQVHLFKDGAEAVVVGRRVR